MPKPTHRQSQEVLLAALKNFTDTVALESHDRHFLRSLENRVFAIDHGQMQVFDGSYDYYLEKTSREQRAA